MRTLIIEDDPNHIRMASKVARTAGFEDIEVFTSLGNAIERIEQGLRGEKPLPDAKSKRLGRELDSLQACDDDYYRRYGDILRAHAYKPATPWLEEGLFSGPNEAASSTKFSILGSRAIGNNRFEVQLRFTQKQTYSPDLGIPPSYDHTEGSVTVILENKRWVIDDFVATYENDERRRLSDGYPECKSGRWVGENPY